MSDLRFLIALAALVVLSGCVGAAETVHAASAKKHAPRAKAERICQPVSAIATGFGKENATNFAQGNLDLAIDKTKDQLAGKGAKGFSIQGRTVKCGDYIDFGGGLGRELKCRASATVCGKKA